MNVESNRRIMVARSEEDMYDKLEQMKTEGYAESDIHVISNDRNHMNTLNRYSDVSTHEAGSFMDKFKSWFTGEDAVKEGLSKLELNDAETERYANDVESGGFVLYTDQSPVTNGIVGSHQNEFDEGYDTFGSTGNSYESYHGDTSSVQAVEPGFEDSARQEMSATNVTESEYTSTAGTEFVQSRFNETETTDFSENITDVNDSTTFGADEPRSETTFQNNREEPQSEYSKEQGFEPSTNEFVNQTEGRFDEPQDRFVRGETFSTDPYMAREKDHIGHSMQEDRMVQNQRPAFNESITNEQQTDGFQSPGADPNLGPAAFGKKEETKFTSGEMNHNFNEDPRFETQEIGEEYSVRKNVDNEEDVTTDQYKERLEKDQYRNDVPPGNKFF